MRKATYTKGEINRLIDGLLHPFARGEDKVPVMVLDAIAHALVEQDPKKSLMKFMRYTAPELVGTVARREGHKRRHISSRRSR